MIVIETFQQTSSDFSQRISLDGTQYLIRITWNVRVNSFFMDILNTDDTPILLGMRLVPNYLLIKDYSEDLLPKGDFYLWDSKSNPEQYGVTFENLGARYILVYITEEELDSL